MKAWANLLYICDGFIFISLLSLLHAALILILGIPYPKIFKIYALFFCLHGACKHPARERDRLADTECCQTDVDRLQWQ
jgi:hypothetical protein